MPGPALAPLHLNMSTVGCAIVSTITAQVRPRYHFSGTRSRFFQRAPYRNKVGPPSRFFGLGPVALGKNKDKSRRWLYAMNLLAMSAGASAEPAGTTPNPFEDEVQKTSSAAATQKQGAGKGSGKDSGDTTMLAIGGNNKGPGAGAEKETTGSSAKRNSSSASSPPSASIPKKQKVMSLPSAESLLSTVSVPNFVIGGEHHKVCRDEVAEVINAGQEIGPAKGPARFTTADVNATIARREKEIRKNKVLNREYGERQKV